MQLTSLSLALTRAGFLSFSPASLFAAGEPGVWYEPSLTNGTCFQDSSGTTPVTAVEQPVGLMLDKSKGLVLGPELVTNGDFSNGTTGWTAQSSTISVENGQLKVITTGSGQGASTILTFAAEKTYKVTVDVVGGVADYIIGIGLGFGTFNNGQSARLSGNHTVTFYAKTPPSGSGLLLGLFVYGAATTYFDNISVRELPGNHATQTTSTSRPVLSARVNLLTKTEQFDDAAWTKTNATVTANAEGAPDGTPTADKLIASTANAVHSTHQLASVVSGVSYTFSVVVEKAGYSRVSIGRATGAGGLPPSGPNWYVDLNTGAIVGSPLWAISVTQEQNGAYRVSGSFTATATSAGDGPSVYIQDSTGTTFVGDGTSGIYIWGASLVQANQAALPYQRVNTATDYDTTGFPKYLKFDGVDDWLVTPTITPGTDKAQVFAGVRKVAGAGFQTLLEYGTGIVENGLSIFAPSSAGPDYDFRLSSNARATSASYSPPITNVLAVSHDLAGLTAATESFPRINGASVSFTGSSVASGSFINAPLYIGRRGGTTLPFNGHLYGLIVRFGANLPAATIASTETWLNQRTGAY